MLRTRSRLSRKIVWVVLPIVVLGVLVFLCLFIRDFHHGDLPFDAVQWRAAGEHWELRDIRGRILDDVEAQLQVGMSRLDVTGLLGPPDERFESGMISYTTSLCHGLGGNEECLDLEFDDDTRLTDWSIILH